MGTLDNKVVLVTGGASGIGRASALMFVREGASVVIADVNEVGGEESSALITRGGGQAHFIRADVSQTRDVEALIAGVLRLYGQLDIAFNNAGIGGQMSLTADKTEEEWDAVIGINLKGVWLCMKHEIPVMLDNGGGAIINMASVAGLLGFRLAGAYAASKHGVIGLTKTAALEYARKNIRVNAVCPYFTDTPMVQDMIENAPVMREATVSGTPIKRLATADEIAEVVVWLASDKASYVTGHALPIDGGAVVQ